MRIESVGLIGGGRVSRILLGGFRATGAIAPKFVVSDPDAEALARLRETYPEIIGAGPDNGMPAIQDLVLVALHPPVMATALEEIKDSLHAESVVVSLAPKITLARLSELLGGFTRVVRMIPNAPSIIGSGYNPVAFGEGLSTKDRATLKEFFQPLGECPEVEESKLEAYALLTGMGPTYFWFQLQVLRELGTEFGLDESDVGPALIHMVNGSARTLLGSELTLDETMDLIPVRPMADQEPGIRQAYRDRLTTLHAKIKP